MAYECECECIAETERAILVVVDDAEYWIPRSQLESGTEVHHEGDEGALVIPEWLAEAEGLA